MRRRTHAYRSTSCDIEATQSYLHIWGGDLWLLAAGGDGRERRERELLLSQGTIAGKTPCTPKTAGGELRRRYGGCSSRVAQLNSLFARLISPLEASMHRVLRLLHMRPAVNDFMAGHAAVARVRGRGKDTAVESQ